MTSQILKTAIENRDALFVLWSTEREIYGVASDETENKLLEARRDVTREQKRLKQIYNNIGG